MKVAYVLLLALMAVAVAANNDIIKHGTVFKPVDKLPLGDDATYIRATDDWTLSLSMDVETDSLTVLALKNINVVFKENGVVDVLKSTTRATFKLGAKVGVNRDIAYVTPDWVSSDDNAPRAVLLSDMKTALFLDLSVNPKGVVSLEGWVVESKFEFTPAVINGAQQFWTYNGKNMIYYDVNGKEPVASGADYNIVHSDVYTTNNGIVLFHNVDKSLKTLQYLTDMDGMKTLNTVVNTAGLTAINKVACSTQACYYLASTTTAPGKQSIVNAVVYNANSAYDAVHTIDNEQYSLFAVDHVTFDNKDLYSSFLLSYPNGITTTTVQYFASISKKTLSGGVTVNDLPLDARGELSASSDIASFQSLAGGLSITYVQDPKTLAPSSLVFNSKGSTPLALPRAMGTKNCKNKIATANILSASLRTDATSTYLEYYSVKTKKTAPTMSSIDLKTRNNFDTVVPHFTGSLCSKQVVKSVGFSFWLANDDQIAPYFVTSAGFIIEDVIPQDVETSPTLFLATFGVASLLIIIWGTIAAVKKPPTVEGGDAEYQTLDA